MVRINCNVTKDLLPLYLDDVVSLDSRQLVEEHLASCQSCRTEAEKMKGDFRIPVDSAVQAAEAGALKGFRKMLRTRRFWTMVVTAAVVIALGFGAHIALHVPQILIPYEEELVQVSELEDGTLKVQYSGETYGGFIGCPVPVNEEPGANEVVWLLYYYHTPWSKYIEPLYTFDEQAMLTENRGWFDLNTNGEVVENVYYAAEPFGSGSKQKHMANMLEPDYPAKYLESAVLIYEAE